MTEPLVGHKDQAMLVSVDQLVPCNYQPRLHFDEVALQQLAESIRQHGILQPLIVRQTGEKYQLVTGERRYRAAKAIHLTHLPVLVCDLTDIEAASLALLENLQRENLNAVEETEGILYLLALNLGCPVEAVPKILYQLRHQADKLTKYLDESGQNVMPKTDHGTSTGIVDPAVALKIVENVFNQINKLEWSTFVKNRLSILNLPPILLDAVRYGRIEWTKAKAIAKAAPDQQLQILELAIKEEWSLNRIKAHIRSLVKPKLIIDIDLARRVDNISKRLRNILKKHHLSKNSQHIEVLEPLLTNLEKFLDSTDET